MICPLRRWFPPAALPLLLIRPFYVQAAKPLLKAVPYTAVRIEDAYWSGRLAVNREKTIPHLIRMCEREGRVRNMWRAAGKLDGPFEGVRHHDADLFKVIEAASCCLATHPDPRLDRKVDRLIAAIAAAQRPDGYLHTYMQVRSRSLPQDARLNLFAAGHLLAAGATHFQATGKTSLLEVARRQADLVSARYGPTTRVDVPPHSLIETALIRLGDITGERRYCDLARFFVDERGQWARSGRTSYGRHNVDQTPLRRLRAAQGHVIGCLFTANAMYDVGRLEGDKELLEACRRVFWDAVTRRMYVTGAMGRQSDEEFTAPYALDNRTALGEGCQSAMLIRLAQRWLLHEADARYADVIERVLYNNLSASVSLDGQTFFYYNRLSARPEDATGRPYTGIVTEKDPRLLPRNCLARQPWFRTPCCPPNAAMTIATVGQYVYAYGLRGVYVNQYIGGLAIIPLAGGPIRLTQKTRYPWDGRVVLAVHLLNSTEDAPDRRRPPRESGVDRGSRAGSSNKTANPAENRREKRSDVASTPSEVPAKAAASREFSLLLRIPDWAGQLESTGGLYRVCNAPRRGNVSLKINGSPTPLPPIRKGYIELRRRWRDGDTVQLDLPMAVLRLASDRRVRADAGRVALQRGPVVYCIEAADHGGRVRDLALPADSPLVAEHRSDLLGGVTVLRAAAVRLSREGEPVRAVPLQAVPYGVWANREVGEMDVWIRQVENGS